MAAQSETYVLSSPLHLSLFTKFSTTFQHITNLTNVVEFAPANFLQLFCISMHAVIQPYTSLHLRAILSLFFF